MHDDRNEQGGTGGGLTRRAFVGSTVAAGAFAVLGGRPQPRDPVAPNAAGGHRAPADGTPVAEFALAEVPIAVLQAGLASGRYTARSLVEQYQGRIAELDHQGPALRAIIELNPDALAIADALDAERRGGRTRGPLHGIPVLIKDNIDTADRMHTSAGSLALADNIAPRDSFVAERLRAAGAIILGKTNLSEWANFRSTHSTSGWSGRGGLNRSPYALDRNTSGSSSGSGVAAAVSYCAAAIGSETDGSITSPSAAHSLVGIKPTIGLVSRAGIIPIAHSQDTAGPMARTVRDAAIVLGALTGVDPRDPATAASRGRSHTDYTTFLDPNGLRGARLGVPRTRYTGYSTQTDKLFAQALDVMKELGATIVDPADIETAGQFDASEQEVLLYEFKADLNRYLAGLKPNVQTRTLADLIAFNERYADREMPYFGQELFEQAQKKGPLTDAAYRKALARNHRLAGREGIDETLRKHRLDALVAPTQGPMWLTDLVNGDGGGSSGSFTSPAAVAGYPHVTVPMGFVDGLPVGISFVAGAWSEPALLKLAYAYEQATKHRRPPTFAAHAAV